MRLPSKFRGTELVPSRRNIFLHEKSELFTRAFVSLGPDEIGKAFRGIISGHVTPIPLYIQPEEFKDKNEKKQGFLGEEKEALRFNSWERCFSTVNSIIQFICNVGQKIFKYNHL